MAPTPRSNTRRRRERDECRQELSKHIKQKLGIEIKPSEVRLNPRSKDPYTWRALLGKEDLFSKIFSKNLSDHSVGTYRLLCKEVGKTFEAVSPSLQTMGSVVSLHNTEPSFSGVIDQLKDEIITLSRQVRELKSQAGADSEQRRLMEEENCQLHIKQQQLENQVQDYADEADYFKSMVARCFVRLDQALPILQGVRMEDSSFDPTLPVPTTQLI